MIRHETSTPAELLRTVGPQQLDMYPGRPKVPVTSSQCSPEDSWPVVSLSPSTLSPLRCMACTHTALPDIVRVFIDVPSKTKVADLHYVTF